MTNVFVMLGGIVLFMFVVMVLDMLGRRKEKRSRSSSG
jgi:NADH:ubiquinone oxidoreductase subunit 6 (subunit J)